jgi:hypothetical protein
MLSTDFERIGELTLRDFQDIAIATLLEAVYELTYQQEV